MKIYKILISPLSGFGTPLKGDTLFGHICWQIFYDKEVLGKNLEELLQDYASNPFLVVSSAFFATENKVYLKTPTLPIERLFDFSNIDEREKVAKRKEYKQKKWFVLSENEKIENLKKLKYINSKELANEILDGLDEGKKRELSKEVIHTVVKDFYQPRNTIKRTSFTTGEDRFAPFIVEQIAYLPYLNLCVFVAIRDDIDINGVFKIFERIGEFGFGKDASVGLGKFKVISCVEFNLFSLGHQNPNAYYTLSPCLPENKEFSDAYFEPFTRFGRHGDILAKSKNPFKNPTIMADEGAVFIINEGKMYNKPYLGQGIRNLSKVNDNVVSQGYSLYIPIRVED